MERDGGSRERERLNLSLHTDGPSTNPLHKFLKRTHHPNQEDVQQQQQSVDEEIELSLGLSLNGRFGVDPSRKKLKRSSSISNLVFTVGAVDNGTIQRGMEFETYAPLARTRSLPTETEEEWRRRKEMQYLRRMEARKKRMEKLKNVRVGAVRVVKDKERCLDAVVNGNGSGEDVSSGIVNGMCENGNNLLLSSQGSIEFEPLGSSSSGNSDLICRQIEGAKQNTDSPSPSTVLHHSLEERKQEPIASASANGDVERDNKESLKNAMLDMPHVTTKGLGPNDRKVEGFLYGYKRGEEVRIVCVCHGLFLTPAEFVKHGGGGGDDDVAHPLKHIVVNPFPLL